jgi:transcriptional regulator with XRE-family HTH domain
MNIGNKIKELRKARGITQEQLANSIGVSFQAVSKWENNIALPDITLAPALASYFDVSLDTLFEFNLKKIEEDAFEIAKESWEYRDIDNEKARAIIDEGLKKYPDNDILLTNRLYVMNYDETPDEVIKLASKIIDTTNDDALKYDACQFMAYAYKAKNDLESARKAIDIVPEFYFTNLELKASILEGEEKWEAACHQHSEALYSLMHMTHKIVDCLEENGEYNKALEKLEEALAILDILKAKKDWYNFKKEFSDRITNIKNKAN